MSCTAPLEAWRIPTGITFKNPGKLTSPILLKCRNCLGCKIDRSREWAVRSYHEKITNKQSMFLTLTYNEQKLPNNQGLNHEHFQMFMKRYREYIYPQKIKYYMCGEYGENFGRPHYHALIFGHRFDDQINLGKPNHYTSPTLEKLWGNGYIVIGNVSFESAAYVARYLMKKITGDKAEKHYKKYPFDKITGEVLEPHLVKPEYNRMSTRPAIGKEWYYKYKTEIYKDQIHINGKQYQVPGYYLKLLKKDEPERYEEIINNRMQHIIDNPVSEKTIEALKLRYKEEGQRPRSLQ